MNKLLTATLYTGLLSIGTVSTANAKLQGLGDHVYYDTDLDISWYAYVNNHAIWSDQMNWHPILL